MAIRPILIASALVALALPAMASAGEWELDNAAGEAFNVGNAGKQVLTIGGNETVSCNGMNGNGAYATNKTGTISLTFRECKTNSFGFSCTTPGQAAGTITVDNKTFHNVIIGDQGDEWTPIGILITGGAGAPDFATFSCFGINFTVTGDVIGEIEVPKCGVEGKNFKLNFESAAHGVQKYRQVTTAGPLFDLVTHSGGAKTTSLDGTSELMFAQNVKPTCT